MLFLYGKRLQDLLKSQEELKDYIESLEDANRSLVRTNDFLMKSIDEEREERRKLQSLILQRTGFEIPSVQVGETRERVPIMQGRMPWPQLRKKLEIQAQQGKTVITEEALNQVEKEIEGKENVG